jgi:hypothetical protein
VPLDPTLSDVDPVPPDPLDDPELVESWPGAGLVVSPELDDDESLLPVLLFWARALPAASASAAANTTASLFIDRSLSFCANGVQASAERECSQSIRLMRPCIVGIHMLHATPCLDLCGGGAERALQGRSGLRR